MLIAHIKSPTAHTVLTHMKLIDDTQILFYEQEMNYAQIIVLTK